MKTFIGDYENGNYVMSSEDASLRAQLICILNTPKGSRFYYPEFGTHLNEYRFSTIDYFTINIISEEVREAVRLMDGVSLAGISYYIDGNKLYFTVDLTRLSGVIRLNISISEGVAS